MAPGFSAEVWFAVGFVAAVTVYYCLVMLSRILGYELGLRNLVRQIKTLRAELEEPEVEVTPVEVTPVEEPAAEPVAEPPAAEVPHAEAPWSADAPPADEPAEAA